MRLSPMETSFYKTSEYLNVAGFYPLSNEAGPGIRAVIWLQGCLKKCPSCINPEMHALVDKQWVDINILANSIAAVQGIEGITLFGGEPFLQHRALAPFLERIKKSSLTVMVYTGFEYAELLASVNPEIVRILKNTDILVDGPYKLECDHNEMWRGSSNQKIIFLSETYKQFAWVIKKRMRTISVRYSDDGKFVVLGIPPNPDVDQSYGRDEEDQIE